jgi:hypothetical protein
MIFVLLAFRRWTEIAARFLFRPFVCRADRHDLERFDLVAQEKSMLAVIDSILFEIGTIDIDFMAFRFGFLMHSGIQQCQTAKSKFQIHT